MPQLHVKLTTFPIELSHMGRQHCEWSAMRKEHCNINEVEPYTRCSR